MRHLPSITKSNEPKEKTAFDMARARAEKDLTGIDKAAQLVAQVHTYDGGQLDLFPQELFKESVLFVGVIGDQQ